MPTNALEILLGYILLIIAMLYIAFPRQVTNIFISIFFRKSYVIVWFKKANTEFIVKWLVVPPPDKQTKIEKGIYNLSELYAINKTDDGRIDGTRQKFFVDEKDNIPRTFEKNSADEKIFRAILINKKKPLVAFKVYNTDEIVFQAQEFQRALQNRIDEFLFTKKRDKISTYLLVVIAVVALLALYEATIIQKNTAYLEYLVQHLNTTLP